MFFFTPSIFLGIWECLCGCGYISLKGGRQQSISVCALDAQNVVFLKVFISVGMRPRCVHRFIFLVNKNPPHCPDFELIGSGQWSVFVMCFKGPDSASENIYCIYYLPSAAFACLVLFFYCFVLPHYKVPSHCTCLKKDSGQSDSFFLSYPCPKWV